MSLKVVVKDLMMCCTRSGDSVLCQDCVAEDLVSEESTLSKNTVCMIHLLTKVLQ